MNELKKIISENTLLKSEIEAYKLKEKQHKEMLQGTTDEMMKIKEDYLNATSKAEVARREYEKLIEELKKLKKEYATQMKSVVSGLNSLYKDTKPKKGFFDKFKRGE